MNVRKLLYVLLLTSLITVCFGSVSPVKAEDTIGLVDQSNVFTGGLLNNLHYFSPFGQSFTPTLPGLDVVELWTKDFSYGGSGAKLVVNIRESTIYGPILGTSNILQLPEGFYGVTHFTFPSVVPLMPGQKYVIEVIVVAGGSWAFYDSWAVQSSGGPYSTYPGGTWIVSGIETPNNDLWFREGLTNPTPPSAEACKKDGWVNYIRFDGSRFKNQGDCIQYVNTGK